MNELIFFFHIIFLLLILRVLILWEKGSFLPAFASLSALISNLFVLKEINIFGCTVTGTDAYTISSLMSLQFIQESQGKERAKKTLWLTLFFLFFFAIMSQIHLMYKPDSHDVFHASYTSLLKFNPRILLASLLSFFVSDRIEIEIFSYLRKTLSFTKSALIASLIAQSIDTSLFTLTGLYGIVASPVSIALFSYAIKAFTLILMINGNRFLRRGSLAL